MFSFSQLSKIYMARNWFRSHLLEGLTLTDLDTDVAVTLLRLFGADAIVFIFEVDAKRNQERESSFEAA